MGYYISIPVLALVVALQSSLLPDYRLLSGQPSLMLLVVLSWAVHADWDEAIFWAFAGGIMQDLLAPVPTGTSVIAPLLMIYALKTLQFSMFSLSLLLLVGFALIGTVVHHIILIVALAITGYPVDVLTMIPNFTLPTLLFNLVGVLPVYVVVRLMQNRLP